MTEVDFFPCARVRGRPSIPDAVILLALEATGGRIGPAAAALGIKPNTIRRRTSARAANPSMRNLPARIRSKVRRLVVAGILRLLRERNTTVLLAVAHSQLCADMGFGHD